MPREKWVFSLITSGRSGPRILEVHKPLLKPPEGTLESKEMNGIL